MTDEEVRARIKQERAEEVERGDLGLWWLSFADSERLNGFLGVVILEGYGMADVMARVGELGLYPGGEVRGFRVDPAEHPEALRNRLLSKRDLAGFGVSTLED